MKPVFLQERVSVLAWRAVPLGLNQQVENFTLCIDSAPQIDHSASDFQIRLIQMRGTARLGAAFSQIGWDPGTEMIYPAPNGLVGDHNPRSANRSSTSRKGLISEV
jgi:hypothetical protein